MRNKPPEGSNIVPLFPEASVASVTRQSKQDGIWYAVTMTYFNPQRRKRSLVINYVMRTGEKYLQYGPLEVSGMEGGFEAPDKGYDEAYNALVKKGFAAIAEFDKNFAKKHFP